MVIDLEGWERANLASIAQHGHAFGNLNDLLQPVTDEYDRNA